MCQAEASRIELRAHRTKFATFSDRPVNLWSVNREKSIKNPKQSKLDLLLWSRNELVTMYSSQSSAYCSKWHLLWPHYWALIWIFNKPVKRCRVARPKSLFRLRRVRWDGKLWVGRATKPIFEQHYSREHHGEMPWFTAALERLRRVIVRHSSDTSTTHVGFQRARGHRWVQPYDVTILTITSIRRILFFGHSLLASSRKKKKSIRNRVMSWTLALFQRTILLVLHL